jgi:hypothetical protein
LHRLKRISDGDNGWVGLTRIYFLKRVRVICPRTRRSRERIPMIEETKESN